MVVEQMVTGGPEDRLKVPVLLRRWDMFQLRQVQNSRGVVVARVDGVVLPYSYVVPEKAFAVPEKVHAAQKAGLLVPEKV